MTGRRAGWDHLCLPGRDGHGHREALWDLRLGQFLTRFLQVGVIGPEVLGIPTNMVWHTAAQALAQPSGFRPEMPDLFYNNNIIGWGPASARVSPTSRWRW